MRSRVLIIVAGLAAITLGQWTYRWMYAAEVPATPLRQLSFADPSGQPHALSEWSNKLLVVNFWATWCPPCKEEMPEFTRLQSEFAARGVQFLGIAIDERKDVKAYLERFPVNYPILMGDSRGVEWASELGNTLQVLPFTAIFDRSGRMVTTKAGQFSRDELLKALTDLGDPPG
jgi:thiol-disulfide isomerase/thioredoxin